MIKIKRKFVLIKDTPELKKGAIVIERCDDGTQGFEIHPDYKKTHIRHDDQNECYYSRKTVLEEPTYFKEVTAVHILTENLKKIAKFILDPEGVLNPATSQARQGLK